MVDQTPDMTGEPGRLTDLFSRTITYLRLSLTDHCNLRCMYCVTEQEGTETVEKLTHDQLLTYEELLRVVRVATSMGISKLRLTGGEPLVRRNIEYFIGELGKIKELDDIRLTTNGVLLARYAKVLMENGVNRVNISLDSLRPERVKQITGVDCLDQVWEGIETALNLGFQPVKVNMVVMRGINDDELVDFARLSLEKPLQIRFIEYMPIGANSRWRKDHFMSCDDIRLRLQKDLGELVPLNADRNDGPARVFRFAGDAAGTLGFISPISHHFCDRCNRLRLTSEGMLRSCLLHDEEVDLRQVLRNGGNADAIAEALLTAIRIKPRGHELAERLEEQGGHCHGRMSRIGG
jgi:cyclic pyranopterin phosphate synthase